MQNVNSLYPKVSIIIVTLNAAKTIQICLDSIKSQVFQTIEVLVMDGGSTDDTVEILKSNLSVINYWESKPDKGIYDAMNKALDKAAGDWILFLGSDDELLPGFSQMCMELIEPSSIYYGSVMYKGSKCSGYMSPYNMAKLGMQHQAMFYSRSIFYTHRYNLKYTISADSVFNMECWKDKSIKFIFKDYVIARFNHTGISAYSFDPLLKKNLSKLIFENFGLVIWLRYMIRVLKNSVKNK